MVILILEEIVDKSINIDHFYSVWKRRPLNQCQHEELFKDTTKDVRIFNKNVITPTKNRKDDK